MALKTLHLKTFDTLPSLSAKVKDLTERSIDLTSSGLKVTFSLEHFDSKALVVDTRASGITLHSGSNPSIEYQWAADDTATEGLHLGEFELTYSTGLKQTIPEKGYIPIFIHNDLNDK